MARKSPTRFNFHPEPELVEWSPGDQCLHPQHGVMQVVGVDGGYASIHGHGMFVVCRQALLAKVNPT